MPPIFKTVSKAEACRRQLEAAIDLYFADGDEVAIHTLVCAAREVANVLAGDKPRGIDIVLAAKTQLLEEHHDEFFFRLSEAYNFFKHASRNPTATVSFSQQSTEWLLLDACSAFQAAVGMLPRIGVFRVWTRATLDTAAFPEANEFERRSIESIRGMSRKEFYAFYLPVALSHDGPNAEAVSRAEASTAPNPQAFKGGKRFKRRKPK